MTNNHLYWTVTTILQEQSGTRRAEIVKHMIKITSVSSYLLSYCHILCIITANDFIYMGLLLPSLEYLKDLRNFNTMFAILRYVLVYRRISVIVYCISLCVL